MNPSFPAIAISRKDGLGADGIHLLWTAPDAAAYSVKGFDIQRRLSGHRPKLECYTLTASDLTTLHQDYRVQTPVALVGVRQAPCPTFPQEPPDEPYAGGEEPKGEQTCIDFQNFPAGQDKNPRTEKGAVFLVRDFSGLPKPHTSISSSGNFKGLDCGVALEIELPRAVSQVTLTLVHFSAPAQVEVFDANGISVGAASMSNQQRVAQTLELKSRGIKRVVVRAPQNEALLLKFCFPSSGLTCIDYQSRAAELGDNPRREQELTFEVRERAGCRTLPFARPKFSGELLRRSQTEIRMQSGFTGLDCGFELEVRLPSGSSAVELTLVSFAQPATVTAFDKQGQEAGRAVMAGSQGQAETLRIQGNAIERVLIESPADETLLLAFCYARIPVIQLLPISQRTGAVSSNQTSSPAASDDLSGNDPGTDGVFLRDRGKDGQPSVFPSVPGLAPQTNHPQILAAQAVTHFPQGCVCYDVNLGEPHEIVTITIMVPGALAIAVHEGKAVDSKLSQNPTSAQNFSFEHRGVDRVLIYVSQAARGLTICADAPLTPQQEEDEWAKVPYIAKGIQLPIKAVNGALGSDGDEDSLAKSRLLAGEIFDDPSFRSIAELLNDVTSDANVTSPVWHTMLTREDIQDPFLEIRPWPFALSLLTRAEWRRILGFGYFDDGNGLTAGDVYDYRITGHFRYRDLKEEVHGFHSIPTGTTLPSTFHIGAVQFNSYVPSVVEIFPAVSSSALSGIGRKGIPLSEGGPNGNSIAITFPSSVTRVVLELEPGANQGLTYEASTSEYFFFGLSGLVFTNTIPALDRVEIDFPEPISTFRLKGRGFLYSVRVPIETRPAGTAPDDLVDVWDIIYGVRYESTPAPSPPPFLGTTNLQQPLIPGDPALTTQSPPRSLGFRLQWLPPPTVGSAPVPWPPDLAAFPPFDVLSFDIERRRVDTGGAFVEIDGQGLSTMFFGSRSSRRDPPQLYHGIDLLEAYPENAPPRPPISVFMEAEDVLDSAKKRDEGSTAPPGSLHQYRISSVDAIGRRSAVATLGSVVRLEKRLPPPQPVSPSPLPLPAEVPQPSGLRARILQSSDPELSADDLFLLGTHTNAVVFEWGWRDEERTQDPYAKEFRVYWQPLPPDIIHGSLTGTATLVGNLFEMSANLDQAVSTDQMRGRYLRAGGYPFKVASHTAGLAITIRFEKSQVDPSRIPAAANFEFHPVLKGDEMRPSAWAERTEIQPITLSQDYSTILFDRLTLDATHPNVRVWIGVSSADDQSYVADELPSSVMNGGRPGNESSIATAAASARYIGRPVFTVPLPLPDVPEQVTDEPVDENIAVQINLPALLPTVAIPAGHKVKFERMSFDVLTPLIGANPDDTIGVVLPDGTTDSYTLGDPTDQSDFLAQIRTGVAGRVENKFLMDFLLRYLTQLEQLWRHSQPEPIPFGPATDLLPHKPERYIHRIRLVDAAGHISAGSAIAPQVVRVPSLSAPTAPEFEMADSGSDTLTIDARVHESHEIKWLALFSLVLEAESALDARTLEKPQLLRLPNRRDLYPNDGLRLRLRDGTLLSPEAFEVSTGVLQLPDRLLSITRTAGFEKRVAVWLVSLTRDGITSRFSGPRIATTGPTPMIAPVLAVSAGTNIDQASWTTLTVPAQVSLERSTDGGTSWSRVTPWLAVNTTSYDIPRFTTGARQYRLVLRNNSQQTLTGSVVTLT